MSGDIISALKPYLGSSGLVDGQNIFGEKVTLFLEPYPTGDDLVIEYPSVPSMEICRRILEHFGEVTEVSAEEVKIERGKTVSGYVGGDPYDTGCEVYTAGEGYLYITID